MSDYIKLFNTAQDQEDFVGSADYIEPHISCTTDGQNLKYNNFTKKEGDLIRTPFTIKMLENGTINLNQGAADKLQYCINEGEGTNLSNDGPLSLEVDINDEIRFNTLSNECSRILTVNSNTKHKVFGNIVSLGDSENFIDVTSITRSNFFSSMFSSDSGLIDAENLIIPDVSLSDYCCDTMFWNCNNLVKAPKLHAMNLGTYCYRSMFGNCTSLVKAPDLPATNIGQYCYDAMFGGCVKLTSPPRILPVQSVPTHCYLGMFGGCTSLKRSPKIMGRKSSRDTSGGLSMFNGCTSLNYIYAPYVQECPGNGAGSSSGVQNISPKGTFVISYSVVDENGDEATVKGQLQLPPTGTIEIEYD